MREAFQNQVAEVLTDESRFRKKEEDIIVGLESELGLFSDAKTPEEIGAIRDDILHSAEVTEHTDIDAELGVTQIEFRTPPISVGSGADELMRVYKERFKKILDVAHRRNLSVLRIGSNPFLPVLETPRTNKPKYLLVPDFQNIHRRKSIDTSFGVNGTRVEIGDASIISLFQAFQVNIQASSLGDGIEKMNRSFMLVPLLVALGANSRYIECSDTGVQESRVLAWEISHDTRTREEIRSGIGLRIGLPERYFAGPSDYFVRVGKYPFILSAPDQALKVGVGLHWLDVRLKVVGDAIVVELRALPTQPTIEEELALTFFFLGRLKYSQDAREELLPMSFVSENRLQAHLYGMQSRLWCVDGKGILRKASAREVFFLEYRRAIEGLRTIGVEETAQDLMEPLERKIISPSESLAYSLSYKEKVEPSFLEDALRRSSMLV